MQIVTDGARINVRIDGDAERAIVLLHGFPFTSDIWNAQAVALSQQMRVVRVDLRGCGASSSPPGPYLMESLAADIAAAMDALGIGAATVGGHSMGGYVALAFARMYAERVEALELVCSTLAPDSAGVRTWRREMADRLDRTHDVGALADASIARVFSERTRAGRAGIVRDARAMMEAIDPAGAAALLRGMALRDGSEDIAPELGMPVTILAGADDPLTTPAAAQAMAGAFPDARVEVVFGCDHLPMLEDPEAVSSSLLRLVERVAI